MKVDGIKADYRRMLAEVGEPLTLRRYTGAGPNRPWFDATAAGREVDYDEREVVGTIMASDRKIILLVEDLIAQQFPIPPRKGDKVLVGDRVLNVEAAPTRKIGIVPIAYEIQARGQP